MTPLVNYMTEDERTQARNRWCKEPLTEVGKTVKLLLDALEFTNGQRDILDKVCAGKDRLFVEAAARVADAGQCCTVAKDSELARTRDAVRWLRGAVVRQMASDESIHGICSDDLCEALHMADQLTAQ